MKAAEVDPVGVGTAGGSAVTETPGARSSVVTAEGAVGGQAEEGASLAMGGTTSTSLGIGPGSMRGPTGEAERLGVGGAGGPEHGVDRHGEPASDGGGKLRGCEGGSG